MNDNLKFERDKHKAALNKRKHGISFEEAITVFYDEDALEFHDPDHSEDEDRFIMPGLSFKTRIRSLLKLRSFDNTTY
ncbi:MAG: BrnT family toxin [Candidatus Omnitrophica bacterium]|nr:BrnT family toxin [Candidatus Omnitrophota bacterium]